MCINSAIILAASDPTSAFSQKLYSLDPSMQNASLDTQADQSAFINKAFQTMSNGGPVQEYFPVIDQATGIEVSGVTQGARTTVIDPIAATTDPATNQFLKQLVEQSSADLTGFLAGFQPEESRKSVISQYFKEEAQKAGLNVSGATTAAPIEKSASLA